jgi:hypothetical protein
MIIWNIKNNFITFLKKLLTKREQWKQKKINNQDKLVRKHEINKHSSGPAVGEGIWKEHYWPTLGWSIKKWWGGEWQGCEEVKVTQN